MEMEFQETPITDCSNNICETYLPIVYPLKLEDRSEIKLLITFCETHDGTCS